MFLSEILFVDLSYCLQNIALYEYLPAFLDVPTSTYAGEWEQEQ